MIGATHWAFISAAGLFDRRSRFCCLFRASLISHGSISASTDASGACKPVRTTGPVRVITRMERSVGRFDGRAKEGEWDGMGWDEVTIISLVVMEGRCRGYDLEKLEFFFNCICDILRCIDDVMCDGPTGLLRK